MKRTLWTIATAGTILLAGGLSRVEFNPTPRTLEQALAQNPAIAQQITDEVYEGYTPSGVKITDAVYRTQVKITQTGGADTGKIIDLRAYNRDQIVSNVQGKEVIPTPQGVPTQAMPVDYQAPQNPNISGNANQQITNYGANSQIITGASPLPRVCGPVRAVPSTCLPKVCAPVRVCTPVRTCTPYVDRTGWWGVGPIRRALAWSFFGPVVHYRTPNGAVVRDRVPWGAVHHRPYMW